MGISPGKLHPNLQPRTMTSRKALQARREWQDIFKVMKGKNLKPRLLAQQGSHSDSTEKLKSLQTSKS